MMNKFEVKNMDLYYGSFHALKKYQYCHPRKKRSRRSSVLPAAASLLS